jgi:hypothetical protein
MFVGKANPCKDKLHSTPLALIYSTLYIITHVTTRKRQSNLTYELKVHWLMNLKFIGHIIRSTNLSHQGWCDTAGLSSSATSLIDEFKWNMKTWGFLFLLPSHSVTVPIFPLLFPCHLTEKCRGTRTRPTWQIYIVVQVSFLFHSLLVLFYWNSKEHRASK